MPSFLGRLLGLSFQTELLIMNLVGLVNSTLDWSPLKWTNKLERIWNLSLSQKTLILDTIGEDTIKTVLSWIVITRIVIAHVYTFTYITNIYPIITWSRPNLLLPWLILSFFKNVVLEVIVIVIGLLIWYETQFSLIVFLEFILVKFVPLILACYNWYSNSCLFLQLRYIEKLRTLRRTMRSDTNLISSRLCAKIEDSKYRTRSLTTLLSNESYETYDTQDTISRILEDPNLTLAQKTMKILGLTEKDIEEARIRIRTREENKRLTETMSEVSLEINRKDINPYLLLESEYELSSVIKMKDEDVDNDSTSMKAVLSPKKDLPIEIPKAEEKSTAIERRLARKKRDGTEQLDPKRTKQMKLCPSCHVNDTKASSQLLKRREVAKLCCSRQSKKSVEKSCSPMKLQTLLNCNCLLPNYPFKEIEENCCIVKNTSLRTSTPKKSNDNTRAIKDTEKFLEDPVNTIDGSHVYSCNVTNTKNDFMMSGSSPLMKKLLKNDLQILKSIKNNQSDEKSVPTEDKLVQSLTTVKIEENRPNLRSNMFSNYRSALKDLQDLSSDLEDLAQTKNVIVSTDTTVKSKPVENEESKTEKQVVEMMVASKSSAEDALNTENNTSKNTSNLPESSGDSTIPRFYKDSMKVFDGCYEKDFDNNTELQCLLQQMEKKKWNLFSSQGSLEMLLTTTFSKDVDHIIEGIQNLTIEDSMKRERYEASASESSKSSPKAEDSQEVKASKQHQHQVSQKTKNVAKVSASPSVKDVHTQTYDDFFPKDSFNSIAEARKRKRRRRLKDQSGSTISINNKRSIHSSSKTESCFSVSKDRSRSPIDFWRRVPNKTPNEEPKRQPSLTKSQSDKSICDCKMQKLEAKYCASSESRFDKKDENQKSSRKQKIDNFGTITLAQVTRATDVESMVFRRKPPLYPKKIKKESNSQIITKKSSANRKPQELMEPKRLADRQSFYGLKTSKAKNHVKSVEEQEAREMRALKAYNEVTLLKDKRDLEAKKKSFNRNAMDRVIEAPKGHSQMKKSTLNRGKKEDLKEARVAKEEHLNKENLLVDATTETDPSVKDTKLPLKAPGARSFNILNDKHPCSKLQSINKITDRLLDNFDRLYGGQVKQDAKKSKVAADIDSRKQYTKYSKPRKLVHEENLSVSSSKKLEGTQKGRELERTPAKEDVRNQPITSAAPTILDQLPRVKTTTDSTSSDAKDKLLMTIKSTVNQDVVSSWSSSTVDHTNEVAVAFAVNLNIEEHMQESLGTEESENRRNEGPEIITLPTIPSSGSICGEKVTEIRSTTEENKNEVAEPTGIDHTRDRRRSDLTDFTRNIDVSYLTHGIVLANTNAQGKSRPRDIVDDRTARLVHNAFFYKSMDSLLDFPHDTIAIEDIVNDNHLESSFNEFVCRSSNETVDVFIDELPLMSHQRNIFEETILATLRETQNRNQPDGNCDLCIITIDHDESSINAEAGIVDGFSRVEGFQQPSVSELHISDILSSIAEIFNIRGLDVTNFSGERLDLLQDLMNSDAQIKNLEIDDVEEQEKIEEEKEECSKDGDDTLRFIKEDIFTNIKFPIVIDRSKLIQEVLTVSNDDSQQLSAGILYGDMVGMNLVPSIEKEEDENNKMERKMNEDIEMRRAEELSSVPLYSENTFYNEELAKELDQQSDTLTDNTLATSENNFDICSVTDSVDLYLDSSNSNDNSCTKKMPVLNETFNIMTLNMSNEEETEYIIWKESTENQTSDGITLDEDIETTEDTEAENIRNEESIIVERLKTEESIRSETIIDDMTTEETKKPIKEADIELDEFRDQIEREMLNINNEEYDDAAEEIEGGKQLSPMNMETDHEEKNIVNPEPEVTIKVVIMFWFIVMFFYIRYFYQKICSFAHISRTTSTLKPFEVHTVSTSTSTLLEKAKFIETLTEVSENDEDDSTEHSTTDLEEMDDSYSDRSLRRILSSTGINALPNIMETRSEDDSDEIATEIEEMSMNLSTHASKCSELSQRPCYDQESVNERLNYILFNSQVKVGGESSSKPMETAANESVSIFDLEERKLLKTEEEIRTFRFEGVEDSSSLKLLMEDNCQKLCEDQLNISVKAETREEVLESEENQMSDSKIESKIVLLKNNEESSEKALNMKNVISLKQGTSSSEEGVSKQENVEESRNSVEQTEVVSPKSLEVNLEEIDSFNSTYTRPSELSGSTGHSIDLTENSLDEFSIASDQEAQ